MPSEFFAFLPSGALGKRKAWSIKTRVIRSYIPECVTATVESKNIARPDPNLHISVLYGHVLNDAKLSFPRCYSTCGNGL